MVLRSHQRVSATRRYFDTEPFAYMRDTGLDVRCDDCEVIEDKSSVGQGARALVCRDDRHHQLTVHANRTVFGGTECVLEDPRRCAPVFGMHHQHQHVTG